MQGITEDDLNDLTPEIRKQATLTRASSTAWARSSPRPRSGPRPTAPRALSWCRGPMGARTSRAGRRPIPRRASSTWPPSAGTACISLIPGSERGKVIGGSNSNMDYVSRGPGGIRGPQGLPLLKPPFGSIVAVDLNTGDHLFRVPNGDTPASIKNHPALKGVTLPVTGKETHATLLVTKSLLFYGEGRGAEPFLHALDKRTGKEIARVELPATTNTAPMTYLHEGRQYIVLSVAGPGTRRSSWPWRCPSPRKRRSPGLPSRQERPPTVSERRAFVGGLSPCPLRR